MFESIGASMPGLKRGPRGVVLACALVAAGCASEGARVDTPRMPPRNQAASVAAPATAAPASPLQPANAAVQASPPPTPPQAAQGSTPEAAPGSTQAASPAAAADPASVPGFARWVADFQAQARTAGIDEATLQAAFANVQYRPRVVEADRSQSEFTRSVWDYLDRAVTPGRVARGQDRLGEVRLQADAAAGRFGVPAEILVAVWGMESGYGANYGDIPTVDALATLGYEGRRADWARGQLVAALKILQRGDIARDRMLGSWAGAMGQTQFLPTNFLAYAVDADGDGRRDIWGSMADVLASTANFLARVGWQAGEPWAVEVALPAGFDLARADAAVRQSAVRWEAEGLRRADGASLVTVPPIAATQPVGGPSLPISDASVFLPAGARGPAFLVGPNFRAILRYNSSTSYALAVGLLGQQIAGGPGVQAAWPRELQALSREQVRALQEALNQRGFDSGTPDGLVGPATRTALRRYQQSVGLPPDGFPDAELLRRLAP